MPAPVILFEDAHWQRFLPLVYLRGLFELRCGSGELWQRVERILEDIGAPRNVGLWCRPELQALVGEQTDRPVNQLATAGSLLLNGRGFWSRLPDIAESDAAWVGTTGPEGSIACLWLDAALASVLSPDVLQNVERMEAVVAGLPRRDVTGLVTLFEWPWDLVHFNAAAIEADWQLARFAGTVQAPPGVFLLNPEAIHIGAGTRIKPCVVIDAEKGPVWIGSNVTVQPHVSLEGPCYIGNDSLIQPGAVIREGCAFGPRCKIGGELEATVVQSFSNKQHDGFLGHAYLGQWINLGADCLNSDLKNTYGTVRVPVNGRLVETGRQFVGMLMGDYAKSGINVAFPTGAVVGACSNVVVPAPPKFVASLTWLDERGQQPCDIERVVSSARTMMARRSRDLTPALEAALRSLPRQAAAIEEDESSG